MLLVRSRLHHEAVDSGASAPPTWSRAARIPASSDPGDPRTPGLRPLRRLQDGQGRLGWRVASPRRRVGRCAPNPSRSADQSAVHDASTRPIHLHADRRRRSRDPAVSLVPSWLRRYDRGWLTADATAGLTIWALMVPQAMAYAGSPACRSGTASR